MLIILHIHKICIYESGYECRLLLPVCRRNYSNNNYSCATERLMFGWSFDKPQRTTGNRISLQTFVFPFVQFSMSEFSPHVTTARQNDIAHLHPVEIVCGLSFMCRKMDPAKGQRRWQIIGIFHSLHFNESRKTTQQNVISHISHDRRLVNAFVFYIHLKRHVG